MNVLFFVTWKVVPNVGGTEQATISTAKALKKYYGCKCYLLYSEDKDGEIPDCFEKVFQIDNRQVNQRLSLIIQEYDIHVVINQGDHYFFSRMNRTDMGDCAFVFVYHYQPGPAYRLLSLRKLIHAIRAKGRITDIMKLCLHPLYRIAIRYKYRQIYKRIYKFADRVVLLTEEYIDEFARWGHISDKSKFVVIPNMLSVEISQIPSLEKKRHRALIVSRMDEIPKKISDALQIWKKASINEWILDIVGEGLDLPQYKRMVEKQNIPNVVFWGRQNPDKFYQDASIFLMTSKSEGWGLTLTESQQYGVVPIAFNTCAAFKYIIQDGENGYLIEPDDFRQFEERLKQLIADDTKRIQMAQAGFFSSQRFSSEIITEKWYTLLRELHEKKDYSNVKEAFPLKDTKHS